MNRDDVIRMAREAGFGPITASTWDVFLENFANLVAAAEREACAKIVYGLCISDNNAQEIVMAIRARGEKA